MATNVQNATLIYSLGSYVEFSSLHTLEPYSEWIFSFNVPGLNNISDTPQNPFIVQNIKENGGAEHIIEIENQTPDIEDFSQETNKYDEEVSLIIAQASKQTISKILPIIPAPTSVEMVNTHTDFLQKYMCYIVQSNAYDLQEGVDAFIKLIQDMDIETYLDQKSSSHTTTNTMNLVISHIENPLSPKNHGPYYEITISLDNGIQIQTTSNIGVLYALITLQQLWMAKEGVFPCVHIQDYPRFAWRGFMLDTVRQYYSIEEIKRIIRIMVVHKLNTFHWHLTDDEAWRIEIQSYPHLVEKYSYRGYGKLIPPLFGSGYSAYGGSYSQREVKEIITYAQTFGIEIMPEFDMPGHSYSLNHAFKELQEQDDESIFQSVQGYSSNVLNPALESTYEIVENIIDELCSMFKSSRYFHFGGDEIPDTAWIKSPRIQNLLAEKSLADRKDLLGYFYTRIIQKLNTQGKIPAVWEEAYVDTKLHENTLVFSWKEDKAGIDAAMHGYSVVLCPAQYYYFDIRQGTSPYEVGSSWAGHTHVYHTYKYNPIPLNFEYSDNIIGVQANFWGEYFADKALVDYMIFPRLAALAETAWLAEEKKDFDSFVLRLEYGYNKMLDTMKYKYRF